MVEIQSLLFYAKSAKMWLEIYTKNFIQFASQIKKLAFLDDTCSNFGQILNSIVRLEFLTKSLQTKPKYISTMTTNSPQLIRRIHFN